MNSTNFSTLLWIMPELKYYHVAVLVAHAMSLSSDIILATEIKIRKGDNELF